MTNGPLFSVDSLACAAGYRPLFRGLHLALEAGQWIELTGPNGTGKSTLLRCLAGLTRPVAGHMKWRAEPVNPSSRQWRQHLLYQGHAPALKDGMSCAENLATWLALDQGCRPSKASLEKALDGVGILRCADLPAASLSAGQRRRVQLARLASATTNPLWLLDEPGNALDSDGLGLLNQLLDKHLSAGGCALVATHQPLNLARTAMNLHMPEFAAYGAGNE